MAQPVRPRRERVMARLLRASGLALVGAVLLGRLAVAQPDPASAVNVVGVGAAAATVAPAASPAPLAPAAGAPDAAPVADAPIIGTSPGGPASLDPLDVTVKAAFVIGLLLVTLRVLRRFGSGPRDPRARITVLESRSVAHKAQVVLVAVGERRLVVGVTASSMTTLADVDPSDLEPAGRTTTAESPDDPRHADTSLPQGFQAALRRAAAAAGIPGAATFTGGGR